MRHITAAALLLAAACSGRSQTSRLLPQRDLAIAEARLNDTEQRLVEQNGFAIVARGETTSFHGGYTALFEQHQPVYVTADSILYAWHSSYDQILQTIEREHLIPTLRAMLGELRRKLSDSTARAETKADVDNYLAIALSFLDDKPADPVAGGDPAVIASMVQRGKDAVPASLELFGASPSIDFSQFKPRGHYELGPQFQQYFRAMMWLGRVEIEIARKHEAGSPWVVNRRALHGANLLSSLFEGTPREQWTLLDQTIGGFVGPQDNMSMDGLMAAMAALKGNADAPDAEVVAAFRGRSQQKIRSKLIHAGGETIGFLTLGQRFIADSKVFSDLVYGSLATEPPRMMPNPLDIAHAIFKNPAALPLLKSELDKYGEPYRKALAAAAAEKRDPALWEGTLYHGWLDAIGKLSPDKARDSKLPAPLTSDAWSRRMMGTQLASWAELRHDNLLYAKPSYTAEVSCEYPDAYVEPYPAFYQAMGRLATKGKAMIAAFASPSTARMTAYFDGMAKTMALLEEIAERQRANEPLRTKDLDFINRMVSVDGRYGGCGGPAREPGGWYADLYFDRSKILNHEPVIADLHTQPDDENGDRVGHVLHAGTQSPRMLVVRLEHDGGKNAQSYRGFVSTYAEIITKDFQRLTDSEWRQSTVDAIPAWLKSVTAR